MNIEQNVGRVERGKRKKREALILAGRKVMAEKGIDAATMSEIAQIADVGAGTVYSYFNSKEELAVAVLETLMRELAVKIQNVTDNFTDPAQVYAFGVRTVLDTATRDPRWKQLLYRSELIAGAMFRSMGPYAMRDLKNATEAGRFFVTDPTVTWHLATFSIVGFALFLTENAPDSESYENYVQEAIVRILCMTGIGLEDAKDLASRERPSI